MYNEDVKWLSSRLKMIGLSKKEFAEQFGMHPQHVNRFERLKPKLMPVQFKKLAQILQCSFEALIDFWDDNITEDELWANNSYQLVDIDENLILKIISRIYAWETKNQCELALKDKALLIKMIYRKLANVSLNEQEDKADSMIEMYDYMKKTS